MTRLLNIGLLLAFTLCYIEWGRSYPAFIFQMEDGLFFRKGNWQAILGNLLILTVLAGQLCLLYTTITNGRPARVNMVGVLLLGMIVLLFLLIGILSGKVNIIMATLPFIVLLALFFIVHKRAQAKSRQ